MKGVSISVSVSVCYFVGGGGGLLMGLSFIVSPPHLGPASVESISPLAYPDHNNQLHQHTLNQNRDLVSTPYTGPPTTPTNQNNTQGDIRKFDLAYQHARDARSRTAVDGAQAAYYFKRGCVTTGVARSSVSLCRLFVMLLVAFFLCALRSGWISAALPWWFDGTSPPQKTI